MDQIGIVCQDPKEGFSLLERIAGFDENDGAMFPDKSYLYKADSKEIRWALPDNPDKTAESFIGKAGLKAVCFTETYAEVYDQVLQILAYAEISNNISRYDGIKFGYRASGYRNLDGLYSKTRTEGFGPEAKLAAVMGCIALSKDYYEMYYDKAMRIRRLIKESLRFDTYDVIAASVQSPLAVLAGLPSLAFPHEGKGIQLIADVKKENVLLRAWEAASK